MSQEEWDPLKELATVQRRLNRLFETALGRTDFSPGGEAGGWAPTADVFETSDRWVAAIELPGLDQDALDVRIEGDELVVDGERQMEREARVEAYHRVERSYGKFHRRFPIPSTADRGSVAAVYRSGLLTVTLKKGEGPQRSVRVSIR